MQTINFYILPITDFSNLEKATAHISEICAKISINSDIILLAPGFYDPDLDGNTLFDKIKDNNSTTKYLINFLGKIKLSTKSFNDIDLFDYHNQLIDICNTPNINVDHVIRSTDELIKYYQKSAYCLLDFPELFAWKRKCFPELLFSEDSFGNNHKGFETNLYKQTVDSLLALNNQTNELIRLDINKRINTLQTSLSNIECSGKGRNEDKDFKKKVYTIKEVNGEKIRIECEIICTPHFKLIRRDSDFRIYFSWGNDKIQSQKFIIVKVGSHWNNKIDSSLSEIKLTYN
jgi:hypothetical protein